MEDNDKRGASPYSPESLDYWLFYYDERFIHESPLDYATRMRNNYLKAQNRAPSPPVVSWDTSKPFSPQQARDEVFQARMHVSALRKPIPGNDPVHDPTRLEYYIYEFNPRISKEDVVHYAIRQRNLYLKAHRIPVPYEESILKIKLPEEHRKANNHSAPVEKAERERSKDGYVKDEKGHSSLLIAFLLAVGVGVLIYLYLAK